MIKRGTIGSTLRSLTAICFVAGAALAPFKIATAQEMTTIETYMQQNDFKANPGAAGHVFLRCASLYMLVGLHLQQSTKTAMLGETYLGYGAKLFGVARQLPGNNADFIAEQIRLMTEAYRARWVRAKALSGNGTDDPLIRSDLTMCSAVAK